MDYSILIWTDIIDVNKNTKILWYELKNLVKYTVMIIYPTLFFSLWKLEDHPEKIPVQGSRQLQIRELVCH